MVSRSIALAALGWSMACGYANGDPIVGGDGGTGAPTTGGTSTGPVAGTSSSGGVEGSDDPGVDTSSTGAATTCACSDLAAGERCLRIVNECAGPVWAGASGESQPPDVLAAVDVLAPGECVAVAFSAITGGRAWGRFGCVDDVCETDGGAGRGTLVQFTLAAAGTDVYDVSLVDGFDRPMAMVPVGDDASACEAASCAADLRAVCPEGLAEPDAAGEPAWCRSICRACAMCEACTDCDAIGGTCDACTAVADVCCTGLGCENNDITALWHSLCPDAIAVAGEPSFGCDRRTDFDIVFCP
jgi:hypothetical protein